MVNKEAWISAFARGVAANRASPEIKDPSLYEIGMNHARDIYGNPSPTTGFWYARWLKAAGYMDRMEAEIKAMWDEVGGVGITTEVLTTEPVIPEVSMADMCESLREMIDIIDAQSIRMGAFPSEKARIRLAEERISQVMKQTRGL